MALRINYNQAAFGAQQSLGRTQSAFEQAVGRLSSGLRINKASDDSAGLAVSEKLKNQVRGLNQAQRNAQDAVSLLQTAEGALNETQGLLARMRELAVQSANDTLTNNDRVHIQNEVNQLVSEIDRIAQSTQYNQIALLNKNSAVSLRNGGDALQFHIGANTNLVSGAPSATSGNNALQYSIPAGRAQDLGDVKTLQASRGIAGGAKSFTVDGNTVNYDASVDTIFDVRDAINASGAGVSATVSNGQLTLSKNSSFTVAGDTGGLVANLAIGTPTAGAVTGSTLISDIVTRNGSFYITDGSSYETINYGQSGVLTVSDLKDALNHALANLATLADIGVTADGTLDVSFTNTGGTESRTVHVTYTTTTSPITPIYQLLSDLDAGIRAAAGAAAATVAPVVVNGRVTYDVAAGAVAAMTVNTSNSNAFMQTGADAGKVKLDVGTGNFITGITDAGGGLLAQLNLAAPSSPAQTATASAKATNYPDNVVAIAGNAFTFTPSPPAGILIQDEAPAEFGLGTSGTSINPITLLPNPDVAWPNIATPMTSVYSAVSPVLPGATSLVSGTGSTVAVGSQTSANASISILDSAIESVSTSRGSIGALQNRLLSAMNSLGVAAENTAAANSRIRDADMAQAVSEMTRTQILQQATMAVLAQANQAPSEVVQLLK